MGEPKPKITLTHCLIWIGPRKLGNAEGHANRIVPVCLCFRPKSAANEQRIRQRRAPNATLANGSSRSARAFRRTRQRRASRAHTAHRDRSAWVPVRVPTSRENAETNRETTPNLVWTGWDGPAFLHRKCLNEGERGYFCASNYN